MEIQKTIRFIHRGLILLSLAIIAFCSFPDDDETLKGAIEELKEIRLVSAHNYEEYVDFCSFKYHRDNKKFLEILKQSPDNETHNAKDYILTLDDECVSQMTPSLFSPLNSRIKSPKREDPVWDYLVWFSEDFKPETIKIDWEKIREKMGDEFGKKFRFRDRDQPYRIVSDMKFKCNIYSPTFTPVLTNVKKYEFDVEYAIQNYGNYRIKYYDTKEIIPKANLFQFIDNRSSFLKERREKEGKYLPNLEKVKGLIASDNTVEAIKTLTERLERSKKDLVLYGISINKKYASIIFPLSILFTLLWLISHIRHLSVVISECKEEIRKFPWIGLFSDPLSKVISFLSFVLPLFSLIWLGRRIFSFSLSFDFFLYFSFFSLISIVIILKSLSKLRRKLWDNN